MQDAIVGEPIVDKFCHSVPRHMGFLAAPRERAPPENRDVVSERPERPRIRRHCVVSKVTRHDLPQPSSLLRNWLMHPPPQFLFHSFERTPHGVGPCLPVNQEAPAV